MSAELSNVTQRLNNVYELLEHTFQPHQKKELTKRGFAFLEPQQMEHIYRDQPGGFPEEALQFDYYSGLNASKREEGLWLAVERISMEESLVSNLICRTRTMF